MNCGVGPRRGSDLVLLWLWCRLAAAVPIRPLAWEPPYATHVVLKKKGKLKYKKRSDGISHVKEEVVAKERTYLQMTLMYFRQCEFLSSTFLPKT